MNNLNLYLIILLLAISSCGHSQNKEAEMNNTEHKYTNKLIDESSPYLLQHAHNPVNWYPWGDEALEKAKVEKKLLLISVGYAACHWCHVMEHESFEDEVVAKFMNENYVCIKVDREERPDIDQVYMNAVQLITGRGGWPLNCIALPDGRPIYGGTYFSKDQWLGVLKHVSDFVKDDPTKTEEQAQALTNGVQYSELINLNTEIAEFSAVDLNEVFEAWESKLDFINGGHLGAPKFPLPIGYQFLLQYNHLIKNDDALEATLLTLDKMANGGIYDQVGGGFSRYSVDEYWKVPHFEKMLYDNAQLVSLYSKAYQITKNQNYKTIVSETLEFIRRELTSNEDGFFASLDADSEGVEGKFYVWEEKELRSLLGDNADIIIDYYNVKNNGNWEHSQNILLKSISDEEFASKHIIGLEELLAVVKDSKAILLNERAKRIRPGLDDKIITSWNALMLKAYVDAYRAFNDETFLRAALDNASFLKSKVLQKDGSLFRNYKNGKATINAFLDDYAFMIDAFISLYQVTFDEKWLADAKLMTEYSISHFHNEYNGMFYYTSKLDPALIARKLEVSDNVIPASNSEMAKNLFILGHYFPNSDYVSMSKTMLNNVKDVAVKSGAYYANWDILMAWFVFPPSEVAIIGDDYKSKRIELDNNYLPNLIFLGGKDEGTLSLLKDKFVKGETIIYVCRDKTCNLPVTKVEAALEQLQH